MSLHVLPTRTGGAAENMAVDFLLLQRYPEAEAARFRHYDWRGAAFTFGYSQKLADVRALIAAGEDGLPPGAYDLCRRPSGGGVVDHRRDWTYTLVIPRGHPIEAERATQSYRLVHDCLAAALRLQGCPAELKPRPAVGGEPGPAGLCFQRAEGFDVVHGGTGEKIAGAAQKRNRRGLLCQGSLWRPAAGPSLDWDRFGGDFAAGLARALGLEAEARPWPDWDEEELAGLTERYASPEWLEAR